MLQCEHFADTAVIAKKGDSLVGAVTAYIPPQQPNTLFVWQVAVASEARGCGLAKTMIRHLLERPACAAVRYIETTITPDNQASWALFHGLAQQLECGLEERVFFSKDQHFGGQHEDECLCRIGPFFNHTNSIKS